MIDKSDAEADRKRRRWSEAQQREFGRRLTLSRETAKGADGRRKYPNASDMIRDLELCTNGKVRTYYSHESGERAAKERRIEIYAMLTGVPLDYLLLRSDERTDTGTSSLSVAEVRQRLGIKSPTDNSAPGVNHINVRRK